MSTGNVTVNCEYLLSKLKELNILDRFLANVLEQRQFEVATTRPIDGWLWWEGTSEGHMFWEAENSKVKLSVPINAKQFLNYLEEIENSHSTYEYW